MNSPVLSALVVSDRSTELQKVIAALYQVLAAAHELPEDERRGFAEVGGRAFLRSFAADLVVAEAEELTRRSS